MAKKVKPAWNWVPYAHAETKREIHDQSDLDPDEIYKILGLGDGSHLTFDDDPIFAISRALSAYEAKAYVTGDTTTFAGRHEVLKIVQKRARELADAFRQMDEGNYYDAEDCIHLSLGLEPKEFDFKDETPPVPDIAFFREFSTGYVHRMARILDAAVKEFPNHPDAPKRGRPLNFPLIELIQELAWIYERNTPVDAYDGFTYDAASGEYDGSFFRFVASVIWKFDPSAAKTNNALGSQIRRALSDEMRAKYAQEIHAEFADDPAPDEEGGGAE